MLKCFLCVYRNERCSCIIGCPVKNRRINVNYRLKFGHKFWQTAPAKVVLNYCALKASIWITWALEVIKPSLFIPLLIVFNVPQVWSYFVCVWVFVNVFVCVCICMCVCLLTETACYLHFVDTHRHTHAFTQSNIHTYTYIYIHGYK